MACDIKIQVGDNEPIIIKKDSNGNIQFSEVTEYIMSLPKSTRSKIAAQLRAAKSQVMTDKDIKEHNFISNTNIEELIEQFPQLKEAFPDLVISPNDNFTLIQSNSMQINGSSYFGRVVNSNGQEMFIIQGYYGAEHLFKYLDVKGKINNAFENGKLKSSFSSYQKQLDMLSKKYNMDGDKLLYEFLNNKKQFPSYKEENKYIVPSRILNEVLYAIQGEYNIDNGKTDLQILLESIKEKTNNNFIWKLPVKKLYEVLNNYSNSLPSLEQFSNLSQEELQNILFDIFQDDPKLMKSKINNTFGGITTTTKIEEKEVKLSQAKLKEYWKTLQLQYSSMGVTLGSLDKMIKDSPEQTIGLISGMITQDFPDIAIKIEEGKISATYTQKEQIKEKTSPKYIILSFPWSTLGETYNFSYDSKYLFSPVNEGDVVDGMYKGAYLYKYYNQKTGNTHYAISRHIISPSTYAATYPTLESAKRQIEYWNNTQTLRDYGMYSIKQLPGHPRIATLESKNLKEGQIITIKDIQLPSVRMPDVFKKMLAYTVPQFQQQFNTVDGITDLQTPEDAAIFLFKFVDKLKQSKIDNIKEAMDQTLKQAGEIIKEIKESSTISYLVEKLSGSEATLSYLVNNGNNIDVSGKFENNDANFPTIANMNSAIEYFNKSFGIEAATLSLNELKQFCQENNLEIPSDAKAFVYNGRIYINGSNSNLSDLFHEVAHIFLGVAKVKYPQDYEKLIDSYSKRREFSRSFKNINKTYSGFSQRDKLEEAVADMIAENLFRKQYLSESFLSEDISNDLQRIISKFPSLISEQKDSSLEFEGFMKQLIGNNLSEVQRNMKKSQFIKQQNEKGTIKENW